MELGRGLGVLMTLRIIMMMSMASTASVEVTTGTMIATRAKEPISSRTAEVIIPREAFDLLIPIDLSVIIESETAVAVSVSPDMIAMF